MMHKRVVIILSCMLCIIPFILCFYWDNELIEIEEYNNDVFTKELYEKITKIEIGDLSKEDKQSIHDAFALLAGLKLWEYDHDNGLYGSLTFKIYTSDKKEPLYLIFEQDNLCLEDTGKLAFDRDIREELIHILERKVLLSSN